MAVPGQQPPSDLPSDAAEGMHGAGSASRDPRADRDMKSHYRLLRAAFSDGLL